MNRIGSVSSINLSRKRTHTHMLPSSSTPLPNICLGQDLPASLWRCNLLLQDFPVSKNITYLLTHFKTVSLINKASSKMKYNILNFKLFIYLLSCKLWSSIMHLWLWLWIEDILLYSKQVLNIKFFFHFKVISSLKSVPQHVPKHGPSPGFLPTWRDTVHAAVTQAWNLGVTLVLPPHHPSSPTVWKPHFSGSPTIPAAPRSLSPSPQLKLLITSCLDNCSSVLTALAFLTLPSSTFYWHGQLEWLFSKVSPDHAPL